MERVTATLEGEERNLRQEGKNTYKGSMNAPRPKVESQEYPIKIKAVGENGAKTEETRYLYVENKEVMQLKFIAAKETGEEIGYCKEGGEMDVEIGEVNDFEIRIKNGGWTKEKYYYGNRIFIPSTEYGGIIEELETVTSSGEIVLRGPTWRGMLERKIVEPPQGEDHLVVSGDLNEILRELIGDRFGGLFVVPEVQTGVRLANWKVDRYVGLYDAIMKVLESKGYRLQISYIEPEGLEYGYVQVKAVEVTDYSEQLEYSKEGKVDIKIKDYRGGINHLVCAGEGENQDRTILHLYAQEDGSIGRTQFYFGLEERTAVYKYTSADLSELEEGGIKKLEELQSYKSVEVTVSDADMEIGDIIGGYDEITDTQVKKPIIGKILRRLDGKTTIEHKVKGED